MTGYPTRYVILDTETTSTQIHAKVPTQELRLRLGMLLIVDPIQWPDLQAVYHGFKTDEEGWLPFASMPLSDRPIFVFAHNMGFDSRIFGLWNRLGQGQLSLFPPSGMKGEKRYSSPLFIVDDSIFIVRTFRPDGQRIIWLDTVQWFKKSLAELGEWIKCPKGMMPDSDASDDVWFSYCKQDVDTLSALMLRLWAYLGKHGINDFEYTPASLSRRFYRMRFERKRIRIPDDTSVLELDRMAYYGGYNECFRVGTIKGPVYQIDVNSLYPHVMVQNHFPCEVECNGDASTEQFIPDDFTPSRTTAEVWLEADDHVFPVRGSDQTLWCGGKVRAILAGPELERAWSVGAIRRVGRWTRYLTADLFSSWGTYWRKAREFAQQRGDRFADHVVKHLMNSLHGKFGQQTGEWVLKGQVNPEGSFGSGRIMSRSLKKWIDYRDINGCRWEKSREEEDKDSFVPIAAWTASYGRVYMDWMIDIAGKENVYYIATDSLLVNSRGYAALKGAGVVDTGHMGHFKTEGIHDEVTIWNVNQLDLGTSKRRSGVRRGSVEIADGVWSTESWESCTQGVLGTGQDRVLIANTLIRPSLTYSRREVSTDGTTIPWCANCWNASPQVIRGGRAASWLEKREE